jgi:hypothetical protein
MSNDAGKFTPASPEEQPADVRQALDQELITHQGKKVQPPKDKAEPQSYMGAKEENVTPIQPPMTGASKVTEEAEDESNVNPRNELTPG